MRSIPLCKGAMVVCVVDTKTYCRILVLSPTCWAKVFDGTPRLALTKYLMRLVVLAKLLDRQEEIFIFYSGWTKAFERTHSQQQIHRLLIA
jgi:hypothetical protein